MLLAYELRAVLVTNDEGVKRLAEALGVVTMDPLRFIDLVRGLLRHAEASREAAAEEAEEAATA